MGGGFKAYEDASDVYNKNKCETATHMKVKADCLPSALGGDEISGGGSSLSLFCSVFGPVCRVIKSLMDSRKRLFVGSGQHLE